MIAHMTLAIIGCVSEMMAFITSSVICATVSTTYRQFSFFILKLTLENSLERLVYKILSTFQTSHSQGAIMFIYIALCIFSIVNFSLLITTSAFCCKLLTCCCGVSLVICFYLLLTLNIDV